MKSVFLGLFLVLAFSVVPTFAADNSVSGTWKVKGNVVGNEVEQVCEIKPVDKKSPERAKPMQPEKFKSPAKSKTKP